MNNATSAAIGANLAELGNTAMRMFDPSTRREALLAGNKNALLAAQLSGQNIENQYRPDLFAAQTGAANADAAARLAAAGYSKSQTAGQNIQNAGGEYMNSMLNKPQPTPVGLSQHDDAFYRIGNETGTDPRFLKAVAMFETGNGTSSAYRNKKNLMGASDDRGPLAFANPEESIRRIATTLARENGPYKGQNTIAGIGNIYAPVGAVNDPNHTNGGWSDGVSKYYTQLGGDPNTPVINRGGNPQSPTYSQSDLERMAVAANLFNKGGSKGLMDGIAQSRILGGNGDPNQVRQNQAALFANPGFNTVEGQTQQAIDKEAPKLANQFQIAQNRDLANAFVAMAKTGAGGAGKSVLNTPNGIKELDNMALSRFAMGEGKDAVVTDQTRQYATMWKANVAQYAQAGVPFATAVAMADRVNPSSAIKKDEGGLFSDPSVTVGPEWRNQLVTAEEAAQAALPYAGQSIGGANLAQYLAAMGGAGGIASNFGMPPQTVTPQAVGDIPQTGQAQTVAATPAAVPQTGIAPADLRRSEDQRGVVRTLGAADAIRKKSDETIKSTDYNVNSLRNGLSGQYARKIDKQQLIATALARTPQEDESLSKALYGTGVTPEMFRNAVLDSRALKALGIDPSMVSSIYNQQSSVSTNDVDSRLKKYQ